MNNVKAMNFQGASQQRAAVSVPAVPRFAPRMAWSIGLLMLTAGGSLSAQTPAPGSTGDAYFRGSSFPAKVEPSPSDQAESTPRAAQSRQLVVGSAGMQSSLPGKPFEPGEVVAMVGGEPLLVGDMLLEVNQILNQHLPNAPAEIKQRERRNVIRAMAPKFVDAKLLYQDGISGLPDGVDLDSVLKQAEKEFDENALPKLMQRSGIDSVSGYDAHLRALGSSLRQFRTTWAREQLASHLIRQKLKINEDISHAQLLEYYRAHEADFFHPARARWEELMVRFDQFPDRSSAQAQIVELGNQVVYGASFPAVARESSQGFTAATGGNYDWTLAGSLANKEIEQAIFSLPVGVLSDVIETRVGFHIIRVVEREDAYTEAFRDAQPAIREKLLDARREEAFQKHLAEIRKKIPNEIVFQQ